MERKNQNEWDFGQQAENLAEDFLNGNRSDVAEALRSLPSDQSALLAVLVSRLLQNEDFGEHEDAFLHWLTRISE